MGQAIGQTLSQGIGVALSPVPIIAVVLLLATPRARVNGPAFLVGWIAGLAAGGTLILVLAGGASPSDHGTPATWVSAVKTALGLLLIGLAVRQWQGRPRGDAEPRLPAWMQTLDTFSAGKAFAMAALLSTINPKNLLLTVSAGAAIAQTGQATIDQAVALAVFVALGTLGVGAPVAIYVTAGERAGQLLDGVRRWLARDNAVVLAVICLIMGAKLIGDAVVGFAG